MSTYTMTKKSLVGASLVVLSVVAGGSRLARADDDGGRGFVELAIGEMTPVGDDEWDSKQDSVAKFALHGGAWARHGLGFELSLDYTGLDSYHADAFGQSIDGDFSRIRLLIGGRGGVPIAHDFRLFGRFLIGADYVRGSIDLSGAIDANHTESDVGLGLEIGGGVLYSLGHAISVGAQIAIPMGFHFTEADPGNNQYADFEYNAYDLDVMLTVGTAF